MTNMSGNFKGRSTMQTVFCLHDTADHDMSLMEIRGFHTSSDENWNQAKLTYWGTADLIQGSGPEHGYFVEDHPNGDRTWGTYECNLSTVNGHLTSEGTFRYTQGTGRYAGISGNGKFKGRMTSPTDVEISWEGSYQLAAGTRAA